MSWTPEQEQVLRNIKHRSAQAHRNLDELNGPRENPVTQAEYDGARDHAIHLLATGLEEIVAFVETLNLVEEHELRSFSGVLKAGEQSLQLEANLTSTSGLVFAEYRIVAPHELVLDGRPDQIRLTNGGDLLLDWAAPFTEDLLIVATKP